ncbi:hypothetical protein ISCGN_018764 [Ixodes scapularis]
MLNAITSAEATWVATCLAIIPLGCFACYLEHICREICIASAIISPAGPPGSADSSSAFPLVPISSNPVRLVAIAATWVATFLAIIPLGCFACYLEHICREICIASAIISPAGPPGSADSSTAFPLVPISSNPVRLVAIAATWVATCLAIIPLGCFACYLEHICREICIASAIISPAGPPGSADSSTAFPLVPISSNPVRLVAIAATWVATFLAIIPLGCFACYLEHICREICIASAIISPAGPPGSADSSTAFPLVPISSNPVRLVAIAATWVATFLAIIPLGCFACYLEHICREICIASAIISPAGPPGSADSSTAFPLVPISSNPVRLVAIAATWVATFLAIIPLGCFACYLEHICREICIASAIISPAGPPGSADSSTAFPLVPISSNPVRLVAIAVYK